MGEGRGEGLASSSSFRSLPTLFMVHYTLHPCIGGFRKAAVGVVQTKRTTDPQSIEQSVARSTQASSCAQVHASFRAPHPLRQTLRRLRRSHAAPAGLRWLRVYGVQVALHFRVDQRCAPTLGCDQVFGTCRHSWNTKNTTRHKARWWGMGSWCMARPILCEAVNRNS